VKQGSLIHQGPCPTCSLTYIPCLGAGDSSVHSHCCRHGEQVEYLPRVTHVAIKSFVIPRRHAQRQPYPVQVLGLFPFPLIIEPGPLQYTSHELMKEGKVFGMWIYIQLHIYLLNVALYPGMIKTLELYQCTKHTQTFPSWGSHSRIPMLYDGEFAFFNALKALSRSSSLLTISSNHWQLGL
jgi:hypothetical protein